MLNVAEGGVGPRMRAALANLDEGEFTEGHELDRKSIARQFQRSAKLTI